MEKQYGYIARQIESDKTICLNNSNLVSTVESTNRLGTYVKNIQGGTLLYHNGILLVSTDLENSLLSGDDGKFGDVVLNTQSKACINITIQDYNKLLKNINVVNYKPYNKHDVYNLVSDVERADTIYYTEVEQGYLFNHNNKLIVWQSKEHVIYNNVIGVTPESEYEVNFNNDIFNTDCPYIDVKYFNPVIVSGDKINLELRVCDLYDSLLNYDTIGPRYDSNGNKIEDGIYKIIISVDGLLPVTKYTYAGNIFINTPPFVISDDSEYKESYFTVQCIDSRGVSSIKLYFDVFIRKSEYLENYLEVTDEMLDLYGITYDGSPTDNISAYKNKLAFNKLFADASENYNGVRLPEHYYYLDYHESVPRPSGDDEDPDPDIPVLPPEPDEDETLTFLHISDLHTYPDSLEKCGKLIDSDSSIKFVVLTGDYANNSEISYVSSRMRTALSEFGAKYPGKLLVLPGNHEAFNTSTWDGSLTTSYSNIAHNSRLGIRNYALKLNEVMNNSTLKYGGYNKAKGIPVTPYYYVDYTINSLSKLRVICIDLYERWVYAKPTKVKNCYEGNGYNSLRRYKPVYSLQLIDWIVGCLKGKLETEELGVYLSSAAGTITIVYPEIEPLTKNDYVLIALHEPPINRMEDVSNFSLHDVRTENDFCSRNLRTGALLPITCETIPKILQAYLDRVVIDEKVINAEFKEGNPIYELFELEQSLSEDLRTIWQDPETGNLDACPLTLNYDFSNSSPATLVGYVCGHWHGDMVIRHINSKYSKLLVMSIDCAKPLDSDDSTTDDVAYGDIYKPTKPHRLNGVTINKITINPGLNNLHIQRIGNGSGDVETEMDDPSANGTYGNVNLAGSGIENFEAFNRVSIDFALDGNDEAKTTELTSTPATNDDVYLGTLKYYYVQLRNGKIISKPERLTLALVRNDVKRICRYPVDSANLKVIDVIENSPGGYDDPPILYVGDSNWYSLSPEEELKKYFKDNYMYLRTFRGDVMTAWKNNEAVTTREVLKNRNLYFVHNTALISDRNVEDTVELVASQNLHLPDHFTLDLNGSTFIAAEANDIDKGTLVLLYKNIDTHIKNGKLVGLYGRYNFLDVHLATTHDVIGEPNAVVAINRGKYCSLDNLDISGSLGYDCVSQGSGVFGGSQLAKLETTMDNNSYLDASGQLVHDDSKEMAVSVYMTSGKDDIAIGRHSVGSFNYTGKKHEVLLFFYKLLATGYLFITYIKTKLYQTAKVPEGSTHVRVVMYGKSVSSSKITSAGEIVLHKGNHVLKMNPGLVIGCSVKNCTMHDCRTIAFGNPYGRQFLFDNIKFYHCATQAYLGISSGGSITPLLSDWEDSWNWTKYIRVSNCTHYPDKSQNGSSNITAYSGEGVEFINNKGFTIRLGGMVESASIKNCDLKGITMSRTRSAFHPHYEIMNNRLVGFGASIKDTDEVDKKVTEETAGLTVTTESTEPDKVVVSYDTAFDDILETTIAFTDCTFKHMIGYGYFKLRHCKVDTLGLDYIN